jgi:ADP-dependent phosphofructokinase/glucokinase
VARERAVGRARAAQRDGRRIACAFTANLDRVVALDQVLADRLFAGGAIAGRGSVGHVDSIDDLLAGIARCVSGGEGGDLPVRDPAVQAWLLELVAGRVQIGGTGAQAAATLAALGFPTLLHLTGRSPEQIAALPGQEWIALGSPDGLVPVAAGSDARHPPMWHVALEFEAGLRLPGLPPAPAANRVIVSHDPVNAAFAIDPGFAAALSDPALGIGTLLISGFSQVTERATLERVLWETAVALRVWRAAHPDLLVHLELGSMPEPADVLRTLEVLHPLVDSIGLNVDELRELLSALGTTMAAPGPALVDQLRSLAARYPVPRWSLHTREVCLTLTERDAMAERDALLFGSLVAATRSHTGTFPAFGDLETTLATAGVNSAGLAPLGALEIAADGFGANGLVATPGLRVEGAAASVGLGDSFTAGVLAML